MNKLCSAIRHKTGELNDSGYPICLRCGSHSYYDYDKDKWYKDGWIYFPYNMIRGFFLKIKWAIDKRKYPELPF